MGMNHKHMSMNHKHMSMNHKHMNMNHKHMNMNHKQINPLLLLLLHLHLVPLVLVVVTSIAAAAAAAGAKELLQFEHAVFDNSNIADLVLVQEDPWYQGQGVSYSNSTIWLTPDPTTANPKVNDTIGNLGRMVYKDPFTLSPTASFSTSFTFRIVTNASVSGSGMAFFFSNSSVAPPYSQAGALGLVTYQNTTDTNQTIADPPYPFFAIEFDTSLSPLYEDPSLSHIGIDINSLVSANLTDTNDTSSPLFLYHNYTFTAWVDYASDSGLIRVWMINISGPAPSSPPPPRPLEPILHYTYNLSSLFDEPVYVGFSSTNLFGFGNLEGLALYAWNFSMTEPDSASSSSFPTVLAIALPIIALLLLALVVVVIFVVYRRVRRRGSVESAQQNHNLASLKMSTFSADTQAYPLRHRYKELKKAASGFSEASKIGEGGYSSVYLAKLPNGSLFALKRLKDGVKKEQDFVSEIEIISTLRHRNLLALEGWCYEKGEALLLYKYMSKGSLDQYIFGKKKLESSSLLETGVKAKILSGIAAGLEYLHTGLGSCILHRDVKAENVLLSDGLEPLLCDFGLARLISHNQEVTLTAVGTPGYVAPELVYTGRGTDKADVYSFGVLALVVACGRRPIEPSLEPREQRLIDWVWFLHQEDRILEALDSSIVPTHEWACVLHLGLTCCHPNPDVRPTMRQVIQVLEEKTLLTLPNTTPTYPMSAAWSQVSILSMSQSHSSLQPDLSSTDTSH